MKTREAVIEAGKTRIIPVLLTALAAIFGLIPLGIGFNIDFMSIFENLNPHIYLLVVIVRGSGNRLAWTIIFGFNICILYDPADRSGDVFNC